MQAKRTPARRDDAVSPVIATILMVAITVVLAATVYVWMSGFSVDGEGAPKDVALTSDGALSTSGGNNAQKTYTLVAATPGQRWSDIKLQLDGATMTYASALLSNAAPDANGYCVLTNAGACEASAAAAGTLDAGDRLVLEDATLDGSTLFVVDSASNSVVYALTVR